MNDAQHPPENAVNETDQAKTRATPVDRGVRLQAHGDLFVAGRDLYLHWPPDRDIARGARRTSVDSARADGNGAEDEAWAPVDLGETEEEHKALVARLIRDGEVLRGELGLSGFPAPEDPAADASESHTVSEAKTGTACGGNDKTKTGTADEVPGAQGLSGSHHPSSLLIGQHRVVARPSSRSVAAALRVSTSTRLQVRRRFGLAEALVFVAVTITFVLAGAGVLNYGMAVGGLVGVVVALAGVWRVQRARVRFIAIVRRMVMCSAQSDREEV